MIHLSHYNKKNKMSIGESTIKIHKIKNRQGLAWWKDYSKIIKIMKFLDKVEVLSYFQNKN